MGIKPTILNAKVMHRRLFPRINGFTYGIYYFALPLSHLQTLPFALNKPGLVSFYEKDHGDCTGDNLEGWARGVLKHHNVTKADGEIVLIAMPRIMGYVFNPVSFWLCHDTEGGLRAVICEVNNTFGERHSYICVHDDQRVIAREDRLHADKLFHVSPFLEREGSYEFRFDVREEKFAVWIDFYDADNEKQLVTSLIGSYQDFTKHEIRKAFWQHPLVTLKAVYLIHWQAAKLIAKGIRHIRKPQQYEDKTSATAKIT